MIDDTRPADFFVTGGTLGREAASYVRRPADDELLRLTLTGEYCNVLTARQMGKSSLMVRTADRLRAQGRRAVIIDLTAIGSDVTASEWYFGLATRLAQQLELVTDEKEWWQKHAERSPVQRFSDFLREVVLEEIKDPVVVFVDEIDSTLKLKFTDDFFASIRSMYNARASDAVYRRLTFVLLGVARPADLIKDRTRTPYNIGVNVDLPDFRIDELKTFLPVLDTAHPGQGEETLHWVLNWTGGQPYLTQKLCFEVVAHSNHTLAEADIDGLAERLFLAKEARNESNLRSIRDRVLNSPYLAGMLRVYRQVLQGKQVLDEERSLEKNELKLTGIVRATAQGMLEVRNRIYARVFDLDWVKAHTPVSPAQRVAVIASAIAVLAISVAGYFIYRQQTQAAEIQAQTFTNGFTNSASPEVRITNLAGLFGLGGQYVEQARELFFGLSQEERLALFNLQTPGNVGKELVAVVEGAYQRLENTPQDNDLLAAMARELEQVSAAGAPSLVTEITFWLQAREWDGIGRYEDAIGQYDKALAKSEERNQPNAGIYFDRAIVYTKLQQYDAALADFEMVLKLDESWSEAVIAQVTGSPPLVARWAEQANRYPALSAILPALTQTPEVPITLTFTVVPTEVPTAIPTPLGGGSGKIAFVTNRDANYEIYIMNADGSGVTNLTNNRADDGNPNSRTFSWSPDGSRMAFTSDRDGNLEIYVMNADGSGLKRLTNNPRSDSFPVWSPDGTKIAFLSSRDFASRVYVMNTDGSEQTRILTDSGNDGFVSWAPDGTKLAFSSSEGIYVVNIDNSRPYVLTSKGFSPYWSPDGTKIAFMALEGGNFLMYTVNVDGSGLESLTDNSSGLGVYDFRWSPDGTKIAFFSDRDGDLGILGIYVMNADGSGLARLTNSSIPPFGYLLEWSPDSKKIAFLSGATGEGNVSADIYVMNADGSNLVNLTNNPLYHYSFAWQP